MSTKEAYRLLLESNKNKYSSKWLLIYFIIGMFVSAILTLAFVQLELSPQWVTDQTLDNQTQQAFDYGFEQGVYYTAGYTGETGNFTIIRNNTIEIIPLEQYCYAWVQNLNNMEVK
jgi:hypothetical protein